MDSNLSLSIGFKGQVKPNCQAVPLQEGYLKLGGIVDENATGGLAFGVVVSASADNPSVVSAGQAEGNIVRGVCVFDDAIAQNAPAHPDKYLAGLQCAFIAKGLCRFDKWTKSTGGHSIDPVVGAKVQFNTTTGAVEFLAASAAAADTGFALLANASVVEVSDTGAFVWLS